MNFIKYRIIFEYCEADELISREQFYLDELKPEYNMNPIAGSRLRSKHTEKTKALLKETNLGKSVSEETYAKISEYRKGKSFSLETKALMSLAKTGKNHFNFGKSFSAEYKAKISKKVFVYNVETPTILSHEFVSCSETALHFSCSIGSISNYLKSGKLFQKQWILSLSKK